MNVTEVIDSLLEEGLINPKEYLVFALIRHLLHKNMNHPCQIPTRIIAKTLKMHPHSIRKAVRSLNDSGLLKVTPKRNMPHFYELGSLVGAHPVISQEPTGSLVGAHPVISQETSGSLVGAHPVISQEMAENSLLYNDSSSLLKNDDVVTRYQQLTKRTLSNSAKKRWAKYPASYVHSKLDLLEKYAGQVENPEAWMEQALKEDWAREPTTTERRREAEMRIQAEERERRRRALEEAKNARSDPQAVGEILKSIKAMLKPDGNTGS